MSPIELSWTAKKEEGVPASSWNSNMDTHRQLFLDDIFLYLLAKNLKLVPPYGN